MAAGDFLDNFEFIGAAADDFDCSAQASWTNGGGTESSKADNASGGVDGGSCIDLRGATGVAIWYNDVSAGSRFKITEKLLVFWFYYRKGKGANYLQKTSSAIVVRLYFGGTTKYADYRVTDTGDDELIFGWQRLYCSGKNMNGGSTGGTHNNGSDWDSDIHRVELRLDFANGNDDTQNERPVRMDNWYVGNRIYVTSGTTGSPKTFEDIVAYSNGTDRPDGALGVVSAENVFIDCLCGITVGSGSVQGVIEEQAKFILFNQWSEDVKCHLTVDSGGTATFGKLEEDVGGSYPVDGCQLVLPSGRYSDIYVNDSGTLNIYDGKVYLWRYAFLGASGDTRSNITLNRVDIDSCETVYFHGTTTYLTDIEIHNNSAEINNQCAEIRVNPSGCENFLVYDCERGMYFMDDVTMPEYKAQDNAAAGYDLGIAEGKSATIINGVFDETKIVRVT